jgi:hypothetical protein
MAALKSGFKIVKTFERIECGELFLMVTEDELRAPGAEVLD